MKCKNIEFHSHANENPHIAKFSHLSNGFFGESERLLSPKHSKYAFSAARISQKTTLLLIVLLR